MGIIKNVNKNEVGKQLKAYYENSLPLIVQLSQNKKNLQDQIASMKLNTTDYTAQDWAEVQEMVDDLKAKIALI